MKTYRKQTGRTEHDSRGTGRTGIQVPEELIRRMQEEILLRKDEDSEVEFTLRHKNNGIVLHACTLKYGEKTPAPTFYLEHFLEAGTDPEKVPELAQKLLEFGRKSRQGIAVSDHFLERYEDAVPHLGIRLVNRERNLEILQEAAYVPVEDLAVTFFYLLKDPVMGSGSIRIPGSKLQEWGITAEQLYKDAALNCRTMLPLRFWSLSAKYGMTESGPGEIMVLTNEPMFYGASAILYPRVLDTLADAMDRDLWLLPSSVHEFLFMADYGEEPENLKKIVNDVNRTAVSREDFLSDSIYRFRRDTSSIERIC